VAELQIGPIPVSQLVSGVPVSVAVTAFLSIATEADGLYLNMRVIGNLSDLQTKFGPIIDTLPLPNNNCASYSPTNVVARIWGKRLFVNGTMS